MEEACWTGVCGMQNGMMVFVIGKGAKWTDGGPTAQLSVWW